MTGAEAAVKTIAAHGLKHAFGMPGVQNLEYFDAFAAAGLAVTLVSHELAGSFMADAVGRTTGDPGVLVVVPGPGLTNIFTGLGEALLDSVPMLVLIPGIRTSLSEGFQLHEINHEGAARNLAKHYVRVDDPAEISRAVAGAIRAATSGEPGPAIVEVPYDMLMSQVSGNLELPSEALGEVAVLSGRPAPRLLRHRALTVVRDLMRRAGWPVHVSEDERLGSAAKRLSQPAELRRAADLILRSQRVGLHVGLGAAHAAAEVLELASRLDAPVSTTISGRGIVPEDHDLSVGFGFGPSGTELAEKMFADRDLIVAIGCKFSEAGSGHYNLKIPRLIHIDASPAVLGRNFPAEVMIAGDAKQVLQLLLEPIRATRPVIESSSLRDTIRAAHQKRTAALEGMPLWSHRVNPTRLFFELRKRLPRDAILTTDSGAHALFAVFSFDAYLPRSVLSPVDNSSMGYSIPAAIGASVAHPARRVVAAVGDGGMLMAGAELATARRLGLPLTVVLFNDRALGLVKQAQTKMYRRTLGVDLPEIDWEAYARAFGFDYLRIDDDSQLGERLSRALGSGRAVLLDAQVEYKEQTRYVSAIAKTMLLRMPPGVAMRMAARLAWRTLFG
jgi:acetolactate synthase I/II/III large subunit